MSNRNSGEPWSDMDLDDLRNHLARDSSVAETADFLMRDEDEVREKMRELDLQEKTQRNC